MKTSYTSIKCLSTLMLFLAFNLTTSLANEDYWSLVCPPDVTVDCGDELWDLSIYGDAYISTYGGHLSAGTPTVHYYLNSCGSGYITRTWMAEDPYWNWISCSQTIWVGGGGNFGYNHIQWPKDTLLVGCDPYTHPDVTGYPSWNYVDCSMIGTSYNDMVFTVNDGCRKIMRTWKLMDWCSSGGYYQTWSHRQFIKISNDEVPEFDCPADITVSSSNCKNAYVNAMPLHIDPSTCGGHFKITNNSPFSIAKGADISGTYPIGKTKVGITVNFGCGMKRSCWVNVIVENNKPPSPICLGKVSVALMGLDTDDDGVNDQGMVDIWAKDLEWKSTSNCGFYPLQFSFSPDSIDMLKRFTCDDLGENSVKMYVHDSKGNHSYCVVKVDVQNNGAKITPCERKPDPQDTTIIHRINISGNVAYPNKTPVEGFDMVLIDMESNTQYISTFDTSVVMTKDSFINYSGVTLYFFETDTIITETIDTVVNQEEEFIALTTDKGDYSFEDMIKEEHTYMLKCGEMNSPLSGIDKKDLDALTEYILGTRKFTTAAEYLAADINGDNSIDLSDLTMLIGYIKGDITSFEDSNWVVFLDDASYKTSPANVLDSRVDWMQFDSIKVSITDLNFVIAQRGDIVEEKENLASGNAALRTAEALISNMATSTVIAYPNPFDEMLNLSITSDEGGIAQIKLYDLTGRILTSSNQTLSKGNTIIKLKVQDITESIILYQVTLNGTTNTGKLFKIK